MCWRASSLQTPQVRMALQALRTLKRLVAELQACFWYVRALASARYTLTSATMGIHSVPEVGMCVTL